MSQVKTQPVELIDPRKRQLCSKHFKTRNYPKSFGAFFASSHLKGNEQFYLDFRKVLRQNKWKATKFPRFTSLIRWLLKNNAPRTTIEAVLDTAVIHNCVQFDVYSFEECNFLDDYVKHKYETQNPAPFDYSNLPRFVVAWSRLYPDGIEDF